MPSGMTVANRARPRLFKEGMPSRAKGSRIRDARDVVAWSEACSGGKRPRRRNAVVCQYPSSDRCAGQRKHVTNNQELGSFGTVTIDRRVGWVCTSLFRFAENKAREGDYRPLVSLQKSNISPGHAFYPRTREANSVPRR